MSETARWRELLAADVWPPVALFCFGIWLHAADATLIATILPVAVDEIGGLRIVNWAVALYELGTITAGAVTGLLVARVGVSGVQILGAIAYAAGCALSALAPSMEVLVVGRLFQGLGGGSMIAIAYVGIASLFPSRLTPRLWALISAVWGSSALAGPMIGGWFAEADMWRGAFWAFASQAGVLALLAPMIISRQPRAATAPPRERLPILRVAALAAAVLAITVAGLQTALSPTLALIGGGLVGLALVFLWDRRGPDRLYPRDLWSLGHPVSAGLLAMILLSVGTVAFTTYGPILLYRLHDTPPLVTGYILASGSVGWSVAAVLSSSVSRRREGLVIRLGTLLICVSSTALVLLVANGPVLAIALVFFLQGSGFGLSWAHLTRRLVTSAPAGESAKVSAAVPALQRLGYAIGAALCGTIANQAGLADDAAAPTIANVATWLLVLSVPVVMFGAFWAWRLARDNFSEN